MSSARFEIVRTDDGWHSRFVAANNRVVWTTESYKKRGGAVKAINVIAGVSNAPQFVATWHSLGVRDVGYGLEIHFGNHGLVEVREIDERTTDRSRPGLGTAGVTGAQPDEPVSQAGRPVAGGAG